MEFIASTLGSIPAIVWGQMATFALGAPIVFDNYMLVVEDSDLEDAARQFRSAGFLDSPWSYGSLHPSVYQRKGHEEIYHVLVHEYSNLDKHSIRFLFPPEQHQRCKAFPDYLTKVALLPSSYVHMPVRSAPDDAVRRDGNILWPSAAFLLQSFVQTVVREPLQGMWTSALTTWAISYLYGNCLWLKEDVLDGCDDEKAKAWFNDKIQRFGGGFDRVTVTKRLGRKGYNPNLAQGNEA